MNHKYHVITSTATGISTHNNTRHPIIHHNSPQPNKILKQIKNKLEKYKNDYYY